MSNAGQEEKDLTLIAEQYASGQLDVVCGYAVAANDRPQPIFKEFILFQTREGEHVIPDERCIALLRGLAKNMREMADGMERMAADLEAPPEPSDMN